MLLSRSHRTRRGAIVPLAAVLIPVLLAVVAFAVDVGWIVLTRTQLQSAADAGALAGAEPLMDGYVQYQLATSQDSKNQILTDTLTSARAKAVKFAAYNAAGGVTGLKLRTEDIEFGMTDGNGSYSSKYSGFPNTIKVLLRRDSTANGALALFFGPVVGSSSTDVAATASATIYGGQADGFATTPPRNVALLPITYDQAHWQSFLRTGMDVDGTTRRDASGTPILQVYESVKYKGNFGGLSLNDEHVGASDMRSWITEGVSTSEIKVLYDRGLLPLSSHNTSTWDWQGENGFKASMVMTVNDYTGQTFALPLFKAYSSGTDSSSSSSNGNGNGNGNGKGNGNQSSSGSTYQAGDGQGSHYDYNIVEFVGVKIMATTSANREIMVQPAAYVDPFVSFKGGPSPVGSGNATGLVTIFTTPKLTQ